MFAEPIHFVTFDVCWWIRESDSIPSENHTGESVLALQVKMWKNDWRRSIYRKYVSCNRLQKCGTKFWWGRSFKHWSRSSPGQWFTETEYLRASAIFVSGTSGIPPNLNYRSVSPILCHLEEMTAETIKRFVRLWLQQPWYQNSLSIIYSFVKAVLLHYPRTILSPVLQSEQTVHFCFETF